MLESRISIRTVKDKICRDTISKYVFPETLDIPGGKSKKTQMICILCLGDELAEGLDDAIAETIKTLVDETLNKAKTQLVEPPEPKKRQ